MTRNLKRLGLALAAISALSAAIASGAQAAGVLTWTSGTTKLTAQQDNEGGSQTTGLQQWTTTNGNEQCGEVSGEAAVTGTEATEATLQSIVYQNAGKTSQCTGPFGEAVVTGSNGCDYLFTVGQTIGETGMEATGQTHIKCPAGKQFGTTSSLCSFLIPEQTPQGGHVIFHTITGSPSYVTLEVTLTGITYGGGSLCSSGTNGTFKGNIVIKGFNANGEQQSVEVR
jgi:hypothetical protein